MQVIAEKKVISAKKRIALKEKVKARRWFCVPAVQIPIMVDDNEEMGYERHCRFVELLRIIIVLFLDLLPSSISNKLFTMFGSPNGTKNVTQHAAGYQAIETVYTYPERRARKQIGLTDVCWGGFLNNSLALRNRLKLVKKILTDKISEVSNRKASVCLMSLGSGSARAVIETIAEHSNNGFSPIKGKLIDVDKDAIEFSKALAKSKNVSSIEWSRGYAQKLGRHCNDSFRPDIVEMVGLMDYYPEKDAINLVSEIYKNLAPGGWLITCNIRSNIESPFLTKGIKWPLIYRSPKQLVNIIVQAGFPPQNISVLYEPLKVHGLVIVQKPFSEVFGAVFKKRLRLGSSSKFMKVATLF